MKKYPVLLFIIFLLNGLCHFVMADMTLYFPVDVHDFGVINENDSKIFYDFDLINRNKFPVTIDELISSCSCTTASINNKRINSNDSSKIRVEYDPFGQSGDFYNMIIINYKDLNKQDTIYITGFVEKSPLEICEGYRFRYGDLCINKNTIKLSEVKKEPESTKKTKVQNASAEPIRLKIWGASDTFRFSLLPDTLQPGEEGYLIIKYNPEKDTGIQTEYIYEIKQINSVGEKYIFDFKIISDK